ncbi:hypothetical protein HaLaN_07601 [Haematococcus lacustris]|uniref:Uncharacterized protein n=1 Tax=Haematococcus lacustris TaxID=44745 RepID=A0A699YPV4_HAELA|nr:hypothetical protein HaLaN_07601 [Haematococcus lacustris]
MPAGHWWSPYMHQAIIAQSSLHPAVLGEGRCCQYSAQPRFHTDTWLKTDCLAGWWALTGASPRLPSPAWPKSAVGGNHAWRQQHP